MGTEKDERKKYRPITHWSIGVVKCPICGADIGVPCTTRSFRTSYTTSYVQTHWSRVKEAYKQL